jgi:hypothetical protein
LNVAKKKPTGNQKRFAAELPKKFPVVINGQRLIIIAEEINMLY